MGSPVSFYLICDHERIQTLNLLIRSQMIYSQKYRATLRRGPVSCNQLFLRCKVFTGRILLLQPFDYIILTHKNDTDVSKLLKPENVLTDR